MKQIEQLFNEFRSNEGAIWIENGAIRFSIPKKFQTDDTKAFFTAHKEAVLDLLQSNGIDSKEKFLRTAILRDKNRSSYPLSFAQERLWFIEQFEEGSNAYHIPAVYELHANTNRDALKQACHKIMQRHEILRSRIGQNAKGSEAFQTVYDDLLHIEETSVTDSMDYKALIREDINRPFDLSHEYPIRIKFYQIVSGQHSQESRTIVLINKHHIATDGWSEEIFQRELLFFYKAYTRGDLGAELPALEIQYKDYALWQKSYLTGDLLDQQRRYWKEKLSGFQATELPPDYQRPAKTDYQGASLPFTIDKESSYRLRQLAKRYGVTLHSVMLSALNVLLGKYTGQEDLVVGIPTANRHQQQTESLIGFFVNALTSRTQLNTSQTFGELILETYRQQVEAQQYQDLPFEKIVDELKIERDVSRHPIFQIIFEIQRFVHQHESQTQDDEHMKPYPLEDSYNIERFDLSVFVYDGEEELFGRISYATSLYRPETIEALARHYIHLLDRLASFPDKPYSSHSLSDKEELQRLVYEWNQSDREFPRNKSIVDLVDEQADANPDGLAVICEGISLTYHELRSESDKLARHLSDCMNILPGDRIGVMLNRSDKMIIALLAILKSGAAYVPLDPAYPEVRKKFIADDTALKALITQSEYIFDLGFYTGTVFAIDLQLDPLGPDSERFKSRAVAAHLAYIIYTSGTSGIPKGVMIEHASVVNYIYCIEEILLPEVQRIDFSTNIAFDLTVTTSIAALALGKTIVVYTGELSDVQAYTSHLSSNSVDFIKGTPSLLANLPVDLFKGYRIPQAFIGGEKLEPEKLAHIAGYVKVPIDEYGPTETTVGASFINKSLPHEPGSIGRPYTNYRMYVLDAQLNPVPIGIRGELYIGGAGVGRGYLNQEELTKERFIANPFSNADDKARGYDRIYKTGDVGRWLSDGTIQYLGRNDEQMKIRGFRIEPAEIEKAITAIEGVEQACVLARTTKAGNDLSKKLIAYYTSGSGISEASIRDQLSGSLPDYMIPDYAIRLEQFPLTGNGKLNKKALPDPEKNENETYVPPQNPVQQSLCDIWQEVLGTDKVGIHDNFFRIGGNSILAIQVSHRITKELAREVKVADIFKYKSVSAIEEQLISKITEVKKTKIVF